MIRSILLVASMATAMLAQDAYVKAYYTKWKPGKAPEGQRYVKDVVQKNALEWAKTDPQAIGQVTMTRVLPGGNEIPYDRLRLVFTSAPPDLGGNAGPGTRNTPEINQMLGTLMDGVKTEIWQSVYRHGSLQQGDYVTVLMSTQPAGKLIAHREYLRNWEGPMRTQIVKDGPARGAEAWALRFAGTGYPYQYVELIAYPDSHAAFKPWGSRQEHFLKVHPGKDYYQYREEGTAAVKSVQTVTYRVDLAAWK